MAIAHCRANIPTSINLHTFYSRSFTRWKARRKTDIHFQRSDQVIQNVWSDKQMFEQHRRNMYRNDLQNVRSNHLSHPLVVGCSKGHFNDVSCKLKISRVSCNKFFLKWSFYISHKHTLDRQPASPSQGTRIHFTYLYERIFEAHIQECYMTGSMAYNGKLYNGKLQWQTCSYFWMGLKIHTWDFKQIIFTLQYISQENSLRKEPQVRLGSHVAQQQYSTAL